jgi:hypothetical protein
LTLDIFQKLLDVRTYRTANDDFDNYSVIARLRMSVSHAEKAKGKYEEKYDIAKLHMR